MKSFIIIVMLFSNLLATYSYADKPKPPATENLWIQLNDKLGFVFKEQPKLKKIGVKNYHGGKLIEEKEIPDPSQAIQGYFVTLVEDEWVYINVASKPTFRQLNDENSNK